MKKSALLLIVVALAIPSMASVTVTVDGWGPNQYPADVTPPANAPFGTEGYPGDTIQITGNTNNLNLQEGTYTLNIGTLDWMIDPTYGGTETDYNDWGDVMHNIQINRTITFQDGTSGTLAQQMLLKNTWDSDYITLYQGDTTSFNVNGYNVDVTPLGVLASGWTFGSQPSLSLNAQVQVSTVPAPGALLIAGIGTGLTGWFRRRKLA